MTDETVDRPGHVLFAGGGTGGHVFPGLAVAAELELRGWTVSWVGRAGGMEERLVAAAGLELHALEARPVVGRGPLARADALVTLARSAAAARRLVRHVEALAVVGTGGYVSAPAVVGARLAGRPALLLEPNARAGAANRWLSRWCRGAAVAYESAAQDFRCPVEVTGVPVRQEFFSQPPEPPAGPLRLLVLGGSSGALHLNRYLPQVLERLAAELSELVVVHQVGPHGEVTEGAYAERSLGGIDLRLVPFIDDVAREMAAAHLIVSRAGAVTLAEICAAGRPAMLVPLRLAGAHQRRNAEELVAAGGAEILDEGTSAAAGAERIAALLRDGDRRRAMGEALRGLARPDAARRIGDLVAAAAGAPRTAKGSASRDGAVDASRDDAVDGEEARR